MTSHPDTQDNNESEEKTPPVLRELSVPDETIERVLSPEETLVKKPSTFDLKVPPDLKRETRYGEAILDKTAHLKLVLKGYTTKTVTVEIDDTFVIGRTSSNASTKPDLNLNRYGGYICGVSRKHLTITKDANMLTVTDMDSRNGTFLNGVKLNPNQPRILRDGDELCLGTLFMRVYFTSGTLNGLTNSDDINR